MKFLMHAFDVSALVLAAVLAGPVVAPPISDIDLPPATLPAQPARLISFPDLRLEWSGPTGADELNTSDGGLRSPCRTYADEPPAQPGAEFAECWNEKKTAWERTKPSAIGPSLPQMNSPLGSDSIKSGAPRQTPVP